MVCFQGFVVIFLHHSVFGAVLVTVFLGYFCHQLPMRRPHRYRPWGSYFRSDIAEMKSRPPYFLFIPLLYNIFKIFVIGIEFISMSEGSGGSPEKIKF